MYAVIARVTTSSDPDARAELRRRNEAELAPHLRQAPGFLDSYVVHDDDSGVTHRITVWESQAHAEAFVTTAAAQAWLQTVQEFGARPEAMFRGEVASHISARP